MGRSAGVLIGVGLLVATAPIGAQQLATGSRVPCIAPLSWTVARVDTRFDVSPEDVLRAAREAGDLWERAVGQQLFRFGAEDGFPISLDFDERQANVEEGREREGALEAERAGIEAGRLRLNQSAADHEVGVRRYEQDATQYEWAVRSYNNDMARLARQNEVSASERRELQRQADDLERTARDLERRVRELNQATESMQKESDRLNAWIDAFADRQNSHADAYSQAPTEAGRYDETVFWIGAEHDKVTRRIRVFQFSDGDDLVLILAHELGHALGLGHAKESGAVMSAVMAPELDAGAMEGVTPTDVRMLASRCPRLSN